MNEGILLRWRKPGQSEKKKKTGQKDVGTYQLGHLQKFWEIKKKSFFSIKATDPLEVIPVLVEIMNSLSLLKRRPNL